ncbi:hypothetical protein J6590_067984 [Homalodisca vitripennis]|nr:hypothetical protein J6590_067984 [Homalodisca vitripennis]
MYISTSYGQHGCILLTDANELGSSADILDQSMGAYRKVRHCLRLDSWNLESCSSEEIQRKSTTKKLKTKFLHRFNIRETDKYLKS